MWTKAFVFLIENLFDLYSYVFILRLLLQAVRADYYNPLSLFSIKMTQWAVKPLQKILPEIKRIDLAVVALLLGLALIRFSLIIPLQTNVYPNALGLFLLSIATVINQLLMFYFYLFIIRVILSWVTLAGHNPIFFALYQLTEPGLKIIRRIIPPIAGFDLSCLVAMILTQLLVFLIVNPLTYIALQYM